MAQPRRRRVPVFGLVLITAGVVFLLQTLGVVSWTVGWELFRYWPVLLIAFGVSIILGTRAPWIAVVIIALLLGGSVAAAAWYSPSPGPGKQTISELREPLDQTESLEVTINFGAGTVVLADLPAESSSLVEAVFSSSGGSGEAVHSLMRSGDRAELTLERTSSGFLGRSPVQDWEVRLSRTVTIDLTVDLGASDVTIDLGDLCVNDLDINAGATNLNVILPAAAGFSSADFDVGASSLTIVVPEGVAVRIDTDTGLASVDIDERRFPKVDGRNQSPGYQDSPNRVDGSISGGVADIEVR